MGDIRRDLLADLPRMGHHSGPVRDLVGAFDELTAVTRDRLAMLEGLLARQVAVAAAAGDAADGLVGRVRALTPDGRVVDAGEQVRALTRLVDRERSMLAWQVKTRVSLEPLAVAAAEREAGMVPAARSALRALVDELGLDPTSPEVRRAASRAAWTGLCLARGVDPNPGVVGPALDEAAQDRARRPEVR